MAARPFLKRWWMRKAEWEQTQAGTHRLWRLMVPEGKQREPRRLAAGCLSYCCCCCSRWRLPRVTFDKHVMVFSESTSSFSLECKKVGECFRKGDLLFFSEKSKHFLPGDLSLFTAKGLWLSTPWTLGAEARHWKFSWPFMERMWYVLMQTSSPGHNQCTERESWCFLYLEIYFSFSYTCKCDFW